MKSTRIIALAATLVLLTSTTASAQSHPPTTLIFDLGGVIVGDSTAGQSAFVADLLGVPPQSVANHLGEAMLPVRDGRTDEKTALSSFAEALGGHLPNDWEERLSSRYLSTAPINHAMLALVECLQHNGYRTPLLSDTIALHARLNRERGAYSRFSPVFLSTEIHMHKPAPETYQFVLAQLDVRPETCVFIDDRQDNIDGAQSVGITGIHFQGIENLVERLAQLGVNTQCPGAAAP